MGVIAEIDRCATVAWRAGRADHANSLVGASRAGVVDSGFSDKPVLEMWSLHANSGRLKSVASTPLSAPCHRVAWSSMETESLSAGIVAAGLEDGTVRMWDAAKLLSQGRIESEEADGAVLYGSSSSRRKHKSHTRGIQFNPVLKSLLATGGAEGEIFVWDLGSDPSRPTVHTMGGTPSGSSENASSGPDITDVAWNRKVQHILGTVTSLGVSVIWDLKQKKPLISIKDPRGRRRSSCLSWSSDIATQVLIASEDDGAGAIRLWDLRNASSPIREYSHHGDAGVLDLSWSGFDSDFVVSTSKDSRSMLFSASTGAVLAELPTTPSRNFEVQWSPSLPGVLSSSSFDGHVSIISLLSANCARSGGADDEGGASTALAASFGVNASEFALPEDTVNSKAEVSVSGNVQDLSGKAPKWMLKRCSVSFGFGGRVISTGFTPSAPPKSGPEAEERVLTARRSVKMRYMRADKSFTDEVQEASALFENASLESMLALADDRAGRASQDSLDAISWEYLKLHFTPRSRAELISKFGYSVPSSVHLGAHGCGFQNSPPLREVPVVSPSMPTQASTESPMTGVSSAAKHVTGVSLEDEFAGLAAPWDIDGGDDSILGGAQQADEGDSALPAASEKAAVAEPPVSSESFELQVQNAVIVGDFEKAVAICQEKGNLAEALALARYGGDSLWVQTVGAFLEGHSSRAFSSVLNSVSKGQISELLESCQDWREALAVISTYSSGSRFGQDCEAVGAKLLASGDRAGALAAFLCGCRSSLCTAIWAQEIVSMRNASSGQSGLASRASPILDLAAKLLVLGAAVSAEQGKLASSLKEMCATLDEASAGIFLDIGCLLAEEGSYKDAIEYIQAVPTTAANSLGTTDEILSFVQEAQNAISRAQQASSRASRAPMQTIGRTPAQGGGYQTGGYQAPGVNGTANNVPSVGGTTMGGGYGQPTPQYNAYTAPPSATNSYSGYAPPAQPAQAGAYDTYAAPTQATTVPKPTPAAYNVMQPNVPPPSQNAGPASYQAAAPAAPVQPASYTTSSTQMPAMPSFSTSVSSAMAASQPPSYGAPPPMPGTIHPGPPPISTMPGPPPASAPSVPPPTYEQGATAEPVSFRASTKAVDQTKLPPSAEVAGIVDAKRKAAAAGAVAERETREATVTIDEADVSSVPPAQQIIVSTLRDVHARLLQVNTSPAFAKKMDDVSKKLGKFLVRLNRGEFDDAVVSKLLELCTALGTGDFPSAGSMVQKLTRDHWDNNSLWITALKRLIQSAESGR